MNKSLKDGDEASPFFLLFILHENILSESYKPLSILFLIIYLENKLIINATKINCKTIRISYHIYKIIKHNIPPRIFTIDKFYPY